MTIISLALIECEVIITKLAQRYSANSAPRWLFTTSYPTRSREIIVKLNPLSPGMRMHILLTFLHTSHMELVRRICVNIKTSHPWFLFPLL